MRNLAIDYSKNGVPIDYKCARCGTQGCKLWREYNTLDTELLCAACAAADAGKEVGDLDASGHRLSDFGDRTDQYGFWIPAIPDEEGLGFWGYTSVPADGCAWWRQLPSLPVIATKI